MAEGRGASIHITIGRLTEDQLRSKVAAHLHQIPHARVLVIRCDRATRDAKKLAGGHDWRTHRGDRLEIVIQEKGV